MSKLIVTGQLTLTGGQLTAKETYVAPAGPSGYNLWAWGTNVRGQIGDGTTINKSSPIQIGALTDWSKIVAGGNSLAIKTDGSLWSWGRSDHGELGLGDIANRSSPVQIGALIDWASIDGGYHLSGAIKTNGTLWAWGRNDFGQVGDGTIVSKSSPVQIGSLTDWTSIGVGSSHVLAVKTDGTLWAWGDNSPDGQLGDGTIVDRSSPVQIGALSDWASADTGNDHSLAVKTDGTLWAWGDNSVNGHLGDGTVIKKSSPVQIGSLTNWADVSGGNNFTAAIKTDGTVWTWGKNGQGQLGDGTIVDRSSPVQVGSLTDWASINSGFNHTLAVKTDGTLWTWGDNETSGHLGVEDTINRSSPVQVGSETNWTSVGGGNDHSLALKTTT